ncbi:MAG TPA: hypothetical protein OIM48_04580 [Clostridiaceae bacterium]|nr:hypothetical protein [Clostridiaceae bacterium]
MHKKISYDKLLDGVQKTIAKGEYPEFLKMVNKIKNNYSLRNTILVYTQNPNATIVKGFCDWNKLGRGVKRHPKTIFIYTPIKIKAKKNIEGQQNVEGKETKIRNNDGNIEEIDGIGYRRVAVFDIGDTYIKNCAKRIPILDDTLNSNTTKNLYKLLVDISPVPVVIEEINGIKKGYYSKKENKIAIKESLSQDDRTSVLLHELCHCLYDDFEYSKDRNKSEIFVESVAFLVADYFGFDTSLCSFEYITNWAKNDIKEFMNLANKIKEVADEFIELIKSSEFKQEKISA